MSETSQDDPLKVCFVALNAYPAIDPHVPGGLGGIETRSWLFAKSLAQRPDVEVTFVVRHPEPLRQNEYEGVRVIRQDDPLFVAKNSLLSRLQISKRFPWIIWRKPNLGDLAVLPRLFWDKIVLRRTPQQPDPFLQQLNVDLFVTFGVQSHSATVIASARSIGRKAVLFLGSDHDLDERILSQPNYKTIYNDRASVCLWVIEQADSILCQTDRQRQRLTDLFHRDATIVGNPIDLDWWDAAHSQEPLPSDVAQLDRFALWIGRADSVHKRPQVLLELAKLCPEVPFLMIMNPRDPAVEQQIREEAGENVHIVEKVPFSRIPSVFKNACCLVNTSSLEGFPNTFLQSAASGIPVASLEVEPGFIKRAQAGFFANGDIKQLAGFVRKQWESDSRWEAEPSRHYVIEHHSLERQVDLLLDFLRSHAESS